MVRAVIAGLLLVAIACSPDRMPTAPGAGVAPASGTPIRMLMLTATAGFRHDSIATARQVMSSLAASGGDFTVTITEDLSATGMTSLTNYNALGHFPTTWTDSRFQQQLVGAIRWAVHR